MELTPITAILGVLVTIILVVLVFAVFDLISLHAAVSDLRTSNKELTEAKDSLIKKLVDIKAVQQNHSEFHRTLMPYINAQQDPKPKKKQ